MDQEIIQDIHVDKTIDKVSMQTKAKWVHMYVLLSEDSWKSPLFGSIIY